MNPCGEGIRKPGAFRKQQKIKNVLFRPWKRIHLAGPSDSNGKESACNAGDLGSIHSGSGRSPGEGNGNPLQYSCLENPWGQKNLVVYSPWGCKELDLTEQPMLSLSAGPGSCPENQPRTKKLQDSSCCFFLSLWGNFCFIFIFSLSFQTFPHPLLVILLPHSNQRKFYLAQCNIFSG